MKEVVFTTKKQAEQSQQRDFEVFISKHQNPDYVSKTKKWANVVKRNDGKWVYPACPDCDYSDRVLEDYDSNKYPSPGIGLS